MNPYCNEPKIKYELKRNDTRCIANTIHKNANEYDSYVNWLILCETPKNHK